MKKKDIKILLVDDEPDILEIVGYNLEQAGYHVTKAENGKEAVKLGYKSKTTSNYYGCDDARNGRNGSL